MRLAGLLAACLPTLATAQPDAGGGVSATSDAGVQQPPEAAGARPPVLLASAVAEYPAQALRQRIEGSVVLRLRIDKQGGVVDAVVAQAAGHGFDEAARLAAMQFRFEPARRGEAALASSILYRYDFRLPSPAPPRPPPPPSAVSTAKVSAPAVEVTVRGLSASQRRRDSAEAVQVVDTSDLQRHSADVGEVLARVEGVAVQRGGGLGSDTRLSIHGLTDEQIRFLLDGVPLEFQGFGLGVSTVPLNWVEHIEVYRGVVPVRFGADALGGVVNLVTDQNAETTSATASYAAGAFDTHQLSASASTFHAPTGLSLRATGFYDRARNDYPIDVKVPNELGRLRPAKVRRFHDDYSAGGGVVELGLSERSWAKRLLLRVFATGMNKALQHNIDMSVPYGAADYGQFARGATLLHTLPRVATTPWGITSLVGYARRRLDFRDASRWVHDWFGNRVFERSEQAGEITPFASDLSQWEHRALVRSTLTYRAARGHTLQLVAAPDFTTRKGRERLRLNPERIDPLTTRRDLFQFITGIEYAARDSDDVVRNNAFAKHYFYRPSTDQVDVASNSIRQVENSMHRFGVGDSLRVRMLAGLAAKASYEFAARLPGPDEIFGDGALLAPNTELEPESSHNLNISALFERALGSHGGTLAIDVNGFLRRTEGMIVRLIAQDRIHSIHQNVFNVDTLGTDGTLRWVSPGEWLTLKANATYLDQRNVSERGPFAPFDGQRVPNRPWLFGSASAVVRVPQVGVPSGTLSLSWGTRYVHEFLPGWEDSAAANDSNRIPDQLTHAASLSYSVRGRSSVEAALDLTNLTDRRVYDVLGVQRPGRAAYFKITVCWDCSS
jgi:vitamin B12 transporter